MTHIYYNACVYTGTGEVYQAFCVKDGVFTAVGSNEEILMLLDLGHAAEGAGPLANHMSRKPLSETVSYI